MYSAHHYHCTVVSSRVECFLREEKKALGKLYQIVPISSFIFEILFFNLTQDLIKFDFYPKMGRKSFKFL